jgi:integrase/recombinase XerC
MPQSITLSLQGFLDYLKFQKRYSQHTIVAYQNDLETFFVYLQEFFQPHQLAEIKPMMVRSWLASLKSEESNSSKTINRKISALKTFFKFHLRTGLIEASPMATIVSPKLSKRLPQFIDKRDTETLFSHVEFGQDWNGKTERLIMELLYHTGMRLAELIGIKEAQVDGYGSAIKVLGKGSKERIIPMNTALLKEIKDYTDEKAAKLPEADRVFLLVKDNGKKLYPKYVYNVVKKYLSQVTTIEKKSPHILRHTFATHLANNGADLNAIKELLGHSSLAATQIYTHNSIDKLKDVYKKAHPKA